MMKKPLMIMLFGGLVGVLAGCGQSAQEKVAQEQLKAIEQQKLMIKGFEEAAQKAKAESEKLDLYPPKK